MLFFLVSIYSVLSSPIWVVENGLNSSPSASSRIAVSVCSGLFNRNPATAGAAYTLELPEDEDWLEAIIGKNYPVIQPSRFLSQCVSSGLIKGYVRYNYQQQVLIVPNIITLAGVLDAIPLEDGQMDNVPVPLVFDALKLFNNFSAYDATKYVFENYGQQTTGLSKMNPGLVAPADDPWNPQLKNPAALGLTDYIVKEKLFNFFMWFGCTPLTKEHDLMETISKSKIWDEPIRVYGYDNSWVVLGGDIYEAETTCVSSHNMGAIASENVNNLAFFSRNGPITKPLIQNESPVMNYDSSKTYISFVIGDGDNINFVKSARRSWMESRIARCQKDGSEKGCFPLIWSISPHLLYAAPEMINWFYNQSYVTGKDYFALPPSGYLYSYPTLMPPDVQQNYVANTENDAEMLNTNAVVGWELANSWGNAFSGYFPRYTSKNIVQAIFAVNVPYFVPIVEFPLFDTYRIVNGKLVVFKPREWRGTDEREPYYFLSVQDMAKEINNYKRGTVAHLYTTSDGGFNLDSLYSMVALLDDHVEIVDQINLVRMALQRSQNLH